jgi:hypothetical protein
MTASKLTTGSVLLDQNVTDSQATGRRANASETLNGELMEIICPHCVEAVNGRSILQNIQGSSTREILDSLNCLFQGISALSAPDQYYFLFVNVNSH